MQPINIQQYLWLYFAPFLTYLISKKYCDLEIWVRVTQSHRNWYTVARVIITELGIKPLINRLMKPHHRRPVRLKLYHTVTDGQTDRHGYTDYRA